MYRKIRIKVKNNVSGYRYVDDKILTGHNEAIREATERVYLPVSNSTGAMATRISHRFQEMWNEMLDTPSAGN